MKRLQEMYGDDFHPILKMCENALALQMLADDEKDLNTVKAALDGWDKVAQYTEPKLKAIEVTGGDGGPLEIANVKRTIVNNPDS